MDNGRKQFNPRQLMFKELFVGTLIYAVVLAFFNDYTSLVYAKSFSTIFYAAFLLEVLTFGAFKLKNQIIAWLKPRQGTLYRFLTFFCVWLVMFCSKFVFIWAIDFTFGEDMNIRGFVGILLVAVSVTVIHKLADYTFLRLGE